MNSVAKGFTGLVGLALSALLVVTLVPDYMESGSKDVRSIEGRVAEVSSPCCDAIVLRLYDDQRTYRIPGALVAGRTFPEWGRDLIEKTIQIEVAPFTWSEARPAQQDIPVSRITIGGEVYYP